MFNGLEILYLGIFEVADYESKLWILKFKMADPIWLTKMQKVIWMVWYFVLLGVWDRLFGIQGQDLAIRNGGTNMADANAKITWLGWCLVLGNFRGRWSRSWAQNLEIQNGGANMMEENAKSYLIAMITQYCQFLRLIAWCSIEIFLPKLLHI